MRKINMLSGRRLTLTALHTLPRSIFLLLPLIPLPKPINIPISPEMKIDVKMISGNFVEVSNQKANMTRGNREPKVSISKASNMKTLKSTSKNRVQSKTH
jgi:hypothetical protein